MSDEETVQTMTVLSGYGHPIMPSIVGVTILLVITDQEEYPYRVGVVFTNRGASVTFNADYETLEDAQAHQEWWAGMLLVADLPLPPDILENMDDTFTEIIADNG